MSYPKVADTNEWMKRRGNTARGYPDAFLGYPDEADLGWLPTEFIPLEPDPRFVNMPNPPMEWPVTPKSPARPADEWPIVRATSAPPVRTDLPLLIERMIPRGRPWGFAEPKDRAPHGSAGQHVGLDAPLMGTRGMPQSLFKTFQQPGEVYHKQQRPTRPVMDVVMGDDGAAIANDWALHRDVERVNAVTFRGDKRSPYQLIVRAGGFFPPNTRTDPDYKKRNVAWAFTDYLWRRYQQNADADDVKRVIEQTLVSQSDLDLFNQYVVWKALVTKEASHMARMTDNEFDKAWISTSKCRTNSEVFVTYNNTPGWMYIVIVHSGFVVPFGRGGVWETQEAEIAQYGPITADRIVGFCHYCPFVGRDTPIFLRESFRRKEPKAFEAMYRALSGAPTTAL